MESIDLKKFNNLQQGPDSHNFLVIGKRASGKSEIAKGIIKSLIDKCKDDVNCFLLPYSQHD